MYTAIHSYGIFCAWIIFEPYQLLIYSSCPGLGLCPCPCPCLCLCPCPCLCPCSCCPCPCACPKRQTELGGVFLLSEG